MTASKAKDNFIVFILVIVFVLLAGVSYQIQTRHRTLTALSEASQRIEEAATSARNLLTEAQKAQASPEQIELTRQVRQALSDISDIKEILCSVEDAERQAICSAVQP